MTRKHYTMIAKCINARLTIEQDGSGKLSHGSTAIARLARDMAEEFKRDNSNFRYDVFFEACGLDSFGGVI